MRIRIMVRRRARIDTTVYTEHTRYYVPVLLLMRVSRAGRSGISAVVTAAANT